MMSDRLSVILILSLVCMSIVIGLLCDVKLRSAIDDNTLLIEQLKYEQCGKSYE